MDTPQDKHNSDIPPLPDFTIFEKYLPKDPTKDATAEPVEDDEAIILPDEDAVVLPDEDFIQTEPMQDIPAPELHTDIPQHQPEFEEHLEDMDEDIEPIDLETHEWPQGSSVNGIQIDEDTAEEIFDTPIINDDPDPGTGSYSRSTSSETAMENRYGAYFREREKQADGRQERERGFPFAAVTIIALLVISILLGIFAFQERSDKNDLAGDKTALQQELDTKSTNLTDTQESIDTLNEDNAALATDKTELETQNQTLQTQITTLTEQKTTLTKTNTALKKQVTTAETETTQLEACKTAQADLITKLKAEEKGINEAQILAPCTTTTTLVE